LVFDFFTSQLSAALKTKHDMEDAASYVLFHPSAQGQNQEIYEPYPQLSEFKRPRDSSETELPWVILTNRYILTFIHQQPHVIDVVALHQYKLEKQISQLVLPLASRPLLVPIRYSLPLKLQNHKEHLEQGLKQLGVGLEWIGEHEVQIRSIPLCMPYLDLRLFLDSVAECGVVQQSTLMELMSRSQLFDPRLLSLEEKIDLNELLLHIYQEGHQQPGLFKALTNEACRKLVGA